MPVRHTVDGRLIHLHLEGEYAPGDVVSGFDRALADPALPDDPRLLIDVRRSAVFEARSAQQIQRVAEAFHPRAHRVGGRCAVLVSSDVQFGVARMGAGYTEKAGIEARVFTDFEAACAWLGVETTDRPVSE